MTVWKRRDDWVGTQVEDQFVMIHLESGRYVALNETASQAWETLETPQDRDGLVKALTKTFDIDESTCDRSVTVLLERMRELGLVTPAA